MKKKYNTEEERIKAKREVYKRYNEKHREERIEFQKKYYQEHKEEVSEQHKQYYQEHKEELSGKRRQKYEDNKGTPMLRAQQLCSSYNNMDKIAGRMKGDLTAQWIYDNIIFKSCIHCGKEGWEVIGCNRIDNSKPHTMDNVEPCCFECNCKLSGEDRARAIIQLTLNGEFVKEWKSINACKNNGFNIGHIQECCNRKRKTHKGYKWMYKEDYEKMVGKVIVPPTIV